MGQIDSLRRVKHVVFSGGGFKGFAYVGALSALRQQGIDWGASMPRLESVSGCSIGALFAAAIALGFSVPELEDILFKTNLRSLVSLGFMPGALSLDSGRGLRDLLEELLARKARPHMTLAEIKIKLNVAVANLDSGKLMILNQETAGDVKLVDALMASMALPPIYPPMEIHGALCADGGLINFFPLEESIAGCSLEESLGLRLHARPSETSLREELASASFPIATYLKRVYDVATAPFLDRCWNGLPAAMRDCCITLEVPDIHLVEFGLGGGTDPRREMILAGRKAIEDWLEKQKLKI